MGNVFPITSKRFGDRLKALMQYHDLNSLDLAAKLCGYSQKPKSNTDEYNQCRTKERSIKNHLELDSLDNLNSSQSLSTLYLIEYCIFFKCSADYLLGYIDYPTHEETDISNETGLSVYAIRELQKLTDTEKTLLDQLFVVQPGMIWTIKEMLKVASYIYKKDKIKIHLPEEVVDNDKKTFEVTLNNYDVRDMLSYSLQQTITKMIDMVISNEEIQKIADQEMMEHYKKYPFSYSVKGRALTATELPRYNNETGEWYVPDEKKGSD